MSLSKITREMVEGEYTGRLQLPYRDTNIPMLLPIKGVIKGWGLYGGKEMPIPFSPHEDYGKGYEKVFDKRDNDLRIETLTKINADIDKYNHWVDAKNLVHISEISEKIPPNEKAYNVKELGVESKRYPRLERYRYWLCCFTNCLPAFRKLENHIAFSFTDNEWLYKAKEELDEDDFIRRFNKHLYDFAHQSFNNSKSINEKGDSHSDWSIWDKPIKEFMHWFELLESNDEIKFKDIDPLPEFQLGGLANDVNNSQRENDDWIGNIWGLAEELTDKVIDKDGKGEFKTKKDAWRWGEKNMTCNGEKVTADSLDNEYYKASSRGDIELEKEISDEERLEI